MDRIDRPHNNDSHFVSDPPPDTDAVLPPLPAEQHASEPAGAVERPDLSSGVRCEIARRLADVSEAREAKIRELQDAIKNETYHVTAEQIADKMLRSALRDDLA